MAQKCLGLDIGSANIKIVELTQQRQKYIITQIGKCSTPLKSFRNGRVLNAQVLTSAIQALFQEVKVSTCSVVLGLTSSDISVKQSEFPIMPTKELAQTIQFELADMVRFNFKSPEEVIYSYDISETIGDKYKVVVVGCRREMVEPYLQMFDTLKLHPLAIDVQSFSYPRLFPERDKSCIVDIGAEQTSIYSEIDGTFQVYRILPIGGRHLTEGIAVAFDIPDLEAERFKENHDLDYLLTQGPAQRTVLRSVVQQLIGGISQTLDFIRVQHRASRVQEVIDQMFICGGTSLIPGVGDMLSDELELPVVLIQPFAQLTLGNLSLPADAPIYAGALALALRGLAE